jgi:bacterioferritin
MDKSALIEALNRDLAHEYAAIIQYTQYSAKVRGPWRSELRSFFQAEIADEQLHAQYLADKIAALGGEPTTTPTPVPRADTPEEMLRAILEAETRAVNGYVERAQMAEALGEVALKVHLENMVSDEQNHRQEVEQTLAGWR